MHVLNIFMIIIVLNKSFNKYFNWKMWNRGVSFSIKYLIKFYANYGKYRNHETRTMKYKT